VKLFVNCLVKPKRIPELDGEGRLTGFKYGLYIELADDALSSDFKGLE
jgi:hypothetical protein